MSASLVVEVGDRRLTVTIDRPKKRNALSRSVLEELRDVFETHAKEEGLRVALLRGAGGKSFAAGGDLRDLNDLRTHKEAAEMAERAKAALQAIRRFPVPVVAALNGDALGGGAELALACDFRVAAAHSRIGFLQGLLNITTAWGGGVDLFRKLGHTQALRLLCSGCLLSAEEARAVGLVERVAGADETLDAALDDFLAPMLRMAPQVLRSFKALALEVAGRSPRAPLDARETELFCDVWVHPDHWEAAERFLSKDSR